MKTFDELRPIIEKTKKADWDNEGASEINEETWLRAIEIGNFIEAELNVELRIGPDSSRGVWLGGRDTRDRAISIVVPPQSIVYCVADGQCGGKIFAGHSLNNLYILRDILVEKLKGLEQ